MRDACWAMGGGQPEFSTSAIRHSLPATRNF